MSSLLGVLAVAGCAVADVPYALQRFYEERVRAETGLVEWSQSDALRPDAGGRPRVTFFTSRFAGDTLARTNNGDESGVVVRSVTASAASDDRRPRSSLLVDDQIWAYTRDTLWAEVYSAGGRVRSPSDPRTFGLSPFAHAPPIHAKVWSEFNDFQQGFREWKEGDTWIVRAEMSDGQSCQWWIDPAKGWSIVRSALNDRDGTALYECRLNVAEFNGIWLPTRVEYFDAEFHRGVTPVKTISVHAVEVNEPWHPARLSPKDVGIEAGTEVTLTDARTLLPIELRYWDGAALILPTEWNSRLRSREAAPGPTILREQARIWANPANRVAEATPDGVIYYREPAAASMPAESDWQKYTREFIARYRLDEDQAQRARQICKDCETQRDHYRNRRKAEFAAVEEAERAARASGAAAEEWNKLRENRSRLEAPIQAIFEEQLKPRLEKLPTRAQREAAGPVESESRGPESKSKL